jgi:hypothetical protein
MLNVKIVLILVLGIMFLDASAQNNISVSFSNGFVGDENGGNKAINALTLSELNWTNVQFLQNTSSTDGSGDPIFESQGNDIIGSVLITDQAGTQFSIPGIINWRAPSGSVTTIVFVPSDNDTLNVAGSTYIIKGVNQQASGYSYIGLTYNGETVPITDGVVTGNAATSGLLTALNDYLAAQPKLSIEDATVDEDTVTVTLMVTLSSPAPSGGVIVDYSTQDATALAVSDYTATSDTLKFVEGATARTITLSITDDSVSEPTETFNVLLSNSTNSSIIKNTGVITIADDDVTPNVSPSFVKGANQVICENAGIQTVDSWATSISKGAAGESSQTLTFTVTNSNNSLFSMQPAIDVTGNLTYTPATDVNGEATVSVVLRDDGGTANGGDDTYDTQTFTITVDDNPVITFVDLTKTFGDADFELGATSTSGGTISYAIQSGGTGTATLSGVNNKTVALGDVGTVNIRTTQTSTTGFCAANQDIVLTITPKAITVTADAKSKVYGATDPGLTYQITTGA